MTHLDSFDNVHEIIAANSSTDFVVSLRRTRLLYGGQPRRRGEDVGRAGRRGGRRRPCEALDGAHEVGDGGLDDLGRDVVDDDGLVGLPELMGSAVVDRRKEGLLWVCRRLPDLVGVFVDFERRWSRAMKLELRFWWRWRGIHRDLSGFSGGGFWRAFVSLEL